jgi:hypothetical protein
MLMVAQDFTRAKVAGFTLVIFSDEKYCGELIAADVRRA